MNVVRLMNARTMCVINTYGVTTLRDLNGLVNRINDKLDINIIALITVGYKKIFNPSLS